MEKICINAKYNRSVVIVPSDRERTDGIMEVFIRVFRADDVKKAEDGRLLVRRGGHKKWIIR